MTAPARPIDFDAIRVALTAVVQSATGLVPFMEEPEQPNDPRPALPYIGIKTTLPSGKTGSDSKDYDTVTTRWNSGGVRRMVVGFDCYGTTHEDAYGALALLQASLDLEDVQMTLRAAGIAVWLIGGVADLSKLLNTGYEGRAHMEVQFGVASNVQSDLGYITEVNVDGEVNTNGRDTVDTTLTVTKP